MTAASELKRNRYTVARLALQTLIMRIGQRVSSAGEIRFGKTFYQEGTTAMLNQAETV
jgi:hypothetical protein